MLVLLVEKKKEQNLAKVVLLLEFQTINLGSDKLRKKLITQQKLFFTKPFIFIEKDSVRFEQRG